MTPEQAAEADITAAILVSLLTQGARADQLEWLTHGDGRGTFPPGALAKAVCHAFATTIRLHGMANAIERGDHLSNVKAQS